MSVILTHTEEHEGKKMEITGIYTPKDNTVEEIMSVQIDTPVGMISVTDLFVNVAELDVAVNKIIDRVDRREIYRQEQPDMQDAA
jgi:hypothetical protein